MAITHGEIPSERLSRALQLHPNDPVAIVLADVAPGDAVRIRNTDGRTWEIAARQSVPFGHKIALQAIREGDPVRKYGEVIGVASRPINSGEHVHVHNLVSTRARVGVTGATAVAVTSEPSRVDPGALEAFAAAILTAAGMEQGPARDLAAALIDADLHGYETHGVSRLASYVSLLDAGVVNARPRMRVISDAEAVAVLDGDDGPGHLVGMRAMDEAVMRAQRFGVGLVAVRRGGHLGALGRLAVRAVRAGAIGLVATNGTPVMVPPGGTRPTLGNNPIAIATPGPEGVPYVLDLSLSVTARGKIIEAAKAGTSIPSGWAVDQSGCPTEDPRAALAGGLLPVGGHKGFALASMIELLVGGLSGTGRAGAPGSVYPPAPAGRLNFSHLVGAVRIESFLPPDQFAKEIAAIAQRIKGESSGRGAVGVRLPGERAHATARLRAREGIPIIAAVRSELEALARRFGVGLPEGLRQ